MVNLQETKKSFYPQENFPVEVKVVKNSWKDDLVVVQQKIPLEQHVCPWGVRISLKFCVFIFSARWNLVVDSRKRVQSKRGSTPENNLLKLLCFVGLGGQRIIMGAARGVQQWKLKTGINISRFCEKQCDYLSEDDLMMVIWIFATATIITRYTTVVKVGIFFTSRANF